MKHAWAGAYNGAKRRADYATRLLIQMQGIARYSRRASSFFSRRSNELADPRVGELTGLVGGTTAGSALSRGLCQTWQCRFLATANCLTRQIRWTVCVVVHEKIPRVSQRGGTIKSRSIAQAGRARSGWGPSYNRGKQTRGNAMLRLSRRRE